MKKLFITAIIAVLCVSAFGQLDIVKRDLTATRQITIRDTALYDFVKRHGGSITLTTTGTSGAATLIGGVLNIPQYSGGGGEFQYTKTFATDSFLYYDSEGTVMMLDNAFSIGDNEQVYFYVNPNVTETGLGVTSFSVGTKNELTMPLSMLLVLKNSSNDVFKINKDGFISQTWGADVTAASTITPTGPMFKVTGTTTINTINLPYTGFSGEIKIVFTGNLTISSAGNVTPTGDLASGTTSSLHVYTFVYNPTDSKWYVSN